MLSVVQIPAQLEVQPEVGRHFEEPGQPQRGGRGDSSPAIHDFVDPLVGYVDGISQLALGDAHRQQKLFQQHLAWMGGPTRHGGCVWNAHVSHLVMLRLLVVGG